MKSTKCRKRGTEWTMKGHWLTGGKLKQGSRGHLVRSPLAAHTLGGVLPPCACQRVTTETQSAGWGAKIYFGK